MLTRFFYCYNGRVEKGYKFAILGPIDKKYAFTNFFVLMLYIKFQVPSSTHSLVLQLTKGVTDRRTDGQKDGPNQYAPLTSSKLGAKNLQDVSV